MNYFLEDFWCFRRNQVIRFFYGIGQNEPNSSSMNLPGTIHEILTQKGSAIWCVSPEATVFEAIQIMADKNIGALLVREQDKLIGILTERDYTRKVALRGKASKQTKVKEILSGQVITVTPEHTV